MRRVHYAGGDFVTCEHLAAELVAFGVALANRARAASVEVPVVSRDGTLATVSLLLGPASQLVVIPEDRNEDEIDCADAVARITAARAELLRSSVISQADLSSSSLDWP